MKKHFVKFWVLACFICCIQAADAQDWKSVISGVVNAVVDDKVPVSSSIEGTWNYVAPDCRFTSDNFLAKAGGEVAAKKVEEQMSSILSKLGFTSGCSYVFNADSTYTTTVKGKTTKGTYSYNAETKEIQLKTKLGLKFNAVLSRNALQPNKMSLLFKADKLMSLVQSIGGVLGSQSSNSAIGTANALLKEYDGLQLGFELERQ
jgi:hypothetical protein